MEIVQGMQKEPSSIHLNLNIDEGSLDIDRALTCGLALNELLTNAIKYSHQDRKHSNIELAFSQNEREYILSVADDGPGLPSNYVEQQEKLLGLSLIRMLTKQLGGSMDIRNDGGAVFTIRFPKER